MTPGRPFEDAGLTLPFSLEAERSVLGSILLENSLLHKAQQLLRDDDFYRDDHRRIFRAMGTLSEHSAAIDLVTVKEELERRGELEAAGGIPYLASLVDGVPKSANIEHYARIVKEKAGLRRVMRAADRVIERAASRDGASPGEDLDAVRAAVEVVNQAAAALGSNDGVRLTRIADVSQRTVEWLWRPYVPLGSVTMFDGDPGLGKSLASDALASGTSRGWRLPTDDGSTGEPRTALLLHAEDDVAAVVRPRLEAMGADLERVFTCEPLFPLDSDGLSKMERLVTEVRPALVVIDPIVAFLPSGLDMHRANDVRSVMRALAGLASRHGCAVVCVRHLTKGARERSVYRGLGSIDFAAAARSVLLAGTDPNDPTRERRALCHVKSNYAPRGKSVTFSIRENPAGVPCVLWDRGVSDLTAEDVLAPPDEREDASALSDAAEFLEEALSDGPLPTKEVYRQAKAADIKARTLRRAKSDLKVASKRHGGCWAWVLQETSPVTTVDKSSDEGTTGKVAKVSILSGVGHLDRTVEPKLLRLNELSAEPKVANVKVAKGVGHLEPPRAPECAEGPNALPPQGENDHGWEAPPQGPSKFTSGTDQERPLPVWERAEARDRLGEGEV